MNSIAIIGGGAGGVLMAAHVLRQSAAARVELFERSGELGAGIAYGTEHPAHLLNVAAAGMSAFADSPDHFVNWLAGCRSFEPACGWSPKSFVPRRVYRDYLASLVAPHLEACDARLRVHRAQVVDIVDDEGAVAVVTEDTGRISADAAVLATGNEGAAAPAEPWRRDFWSSSTGFDFAPDATVVIIGTGLSMVDSVVTLLDAGHTGPITAVSRRGLMPRPHDGAPALRIDRSEIPDGGSLSEFLLWLRCRARAAGHEGGWRAVVDGLRPHTQALWDRLPGDAKRRFLRHARPWWDVHRHRMAPEIYRRIEAARQSGQLRVLAARLDGFGPGDGKPWLRIRRRGQPETETIRMDYLVDCRGHSADAGSSSNPLLRRLFESGVARPDALRLGLDVTAGCALVGRDGGASRRVFAVGPPTIGRFWEIVAIPDIRVQAASLARSLVAQEPG